MNNIAKDPLLLGSILVSLLIIILPKFLKSNFSKDKIASLSITFGILGTFTGVFIGLQSFNENDITNSIPYLLNGLKTAFMTSIAGLLTNLIIRMRPKVYGFKEAIVNNESENIGEHIIISLDKLTNSISGDGDASLSTNLMKIRSSNTDGFDKMHKSFESFAEKMVANNTQSLIDALTEVMQDFNTKINEQFGENFKQLNEGVGAMLEWQKEYKNQVEVLNSQFSDIEKNIKGVDTTLQQTANNHKLIYDTNQVLKNVIDQVTVSVSSFSELGNQAKKSFPIIEENMNNLIQTSNRYVKDNIEKLKSDYDNFSETQRKLNDSYNSNIEKMISDNAERIKNLDNELSQELNKSLESLGSHLTSLSQHFVNDYKPLTEALRKLLEMSRGLN